MTNEEAFRALLGDWRLVDCTALYSDGTKIKPIGSNPIGEIRYTADGRMSAHLMSGGQDDPGTMPYAGYFGPFKVDAARSMVTHHVIGASDRAMVGSDQLRRFTFTGNRLTLEADRGDWTARVIWEKY